MRKGIATVSVSGTLTEKLAAIAAAGFDGVEIFENDLISCPLSPERIRDRAADLGLGIDLYQPLRDFEAVGPARLEHNLRRAERKFRLMERLGAGMLLVCSSVSPESADDDDLAAEQLHALAELAGRHGIRVAYEALAWGRHVNEYLHAWRIVQLAGHPNLGTCLDSFHILSRGSDPIGIEAIPGDKVFFLQLADAPPLAMDVLQWSRHYRCFPGQGGFDVTGLVRHVLNTGYQGPLSLEVFNDVFRQSDACRTALDAMRSLIALEESLDRRAPGPVIPTGFAFIELTTELTTELTKGLTTEIATEIKKGPATGPATGPSAGDTLPPAPGEAAALVGLLAAFGFTRTGAHPTKPVEMWEQGEARVLLNATGTGTALAAIGLETPDPAASARRAEHLLAPVLPRERAPGEAPLEAIAAPDGTQIFFCRSGRADHPDWTGDFTGDPAMALRPSPGTVIPATPTPPPPGITRVDHVALTQPWHHFDEASLFYRSVLGLRPLESMEVPEPSGLLRSRAMAGPDEAVRMVLNQARVGARHTPWQHVALSCDDIRGIARRLHAEHPGLLLPIPDNYYDDLEARHDVGPEIRELGLLYDRDEYGEFLHLYTITVGRVFFEIVERAGGYRGYGAANAAVRLAVQHARGPGTP
ncbi:sugar phosphate isomerase/epimerase and 4-hydroxyphenylpyruvate domain-containing protein [Nonomuraea glycinis]|uniref:3-dehydroshikimate dehydratase n=1 Tax=Nonomuraea glycinis TaxID=2047744 RepID=A0A918E4A6_9ACTN|nr:sugar phosphate isomerase/epimerase and 4-hydroxyphenylpyruvate domain-containing protein [Nonomuraea glycinis]MCA2177943.1 sugar phosphate isomerase/epimerase and 4-hydroxyphenylpyruvate domain-containing protein [Nonomuraea glycinis]GGP06368.1 4-hydroxyphenylpyruvate dioxygenase [Nonomuraea glycinis]